MCSMDGLIELKGFDLTTLQNSLEHSPMISLPLRHQLRYIHENIITDGHVFVDHWPAFKNVCSLHTSTAFCSDTDFDFDLVTFYQIGEKFHSNDFENFLRALDLERKWTNRGLYGNNVPSQMIESIKRVLGEHGKLDVFGDFQMYTGLERKNVEEYRKRLDELAGQLPQELVPDILRPCDVAKVTEPWLSGPHEVIPRFFKWLFSIFPSFCLRNHKDGNKLVAWASSYSCGSMATLFIDESYRGQGLSEYLWLSIGLKLADFSPVQPYFVVTPGNAPSEKSAKKAFKFDMKKGDEYASVYWFFFYPRK